MYTPALKNFYTSRFDNSVETTAGLDAPQPLLSQHKPAAMQEPVAVHWIGAATPFGVIM